MEKWVKKSRPITSMKLQKQLLKFIPDAVNLNFPASFPIWLFLIIWIISILLNTSSNPSTYPQDLL